MKGGVLIFFFLDRLILVNERNQKQAYTIEIFIDPGGDSTCCVIEKNFTNKVPLAVGECW